MGVISYVKQLQEFLKFLSLLFLEGWKVNYFTSLFRATNELASLALSIVMNINFSRGIWEMNVNFSRQMREAKANKKRREKGQRRERERERERDRQTDRRRERPTERQTDRETVRVIERVTEIDTDTPKMQRETRLTIKQRFWFLLKIETRIRRVEVAVFDE